jgi:hypothetical protein
MEEILKLFKGLFSSGAGGGGNASIGGMGSIGGTAGAGVPASVGGNANVSAPGAVSGDAGLFSNFGKSDGGAGMAQAQQGAQGYINAGQMGQQNPWAQDSSQQFANPAGIMGMLQGMQGMAQQPKPQIPFYQQMSNMMGIR